MTTRNEYMRERVVVHRIAETLYVLFHASVLLRSDPYEVAGMGGSIPPYWHGVDYARRDAFEVDVRSFLASDATRLPLFSYVGTTVEPAYQLAPDTIATIARSLYTLFMAETEPRSGAAGVAKKEGTK